MELVRTPEPVCHFGEVPDGMQEGAPPFPLGKPRYNFFYLPPTEEKPIEMGTTQPYPTPQEEGCRCGGRTMLLLCWEIPLEQQQFMPRPLQRLYSQEASAPTPCHTILFVLSFWDRSTVQSTVHIVLWPPNLYECPDAYLATIHLSQVNCCEWELQRYSP